MYFKLVAIIHKIKPDIIQTFDGHEPSTVVVSLAKPFFKYKLFTGVHTILITFRQVVNWKKLTWKRLKVILRLIVTQDHAPQCML